MCVGVCVCVCVCMCVCGMCVLVGGAWEWVFLGVPPLSFHSLQWLCLAWDLCMCVCVCVCMCVYWHCACWSDSNVKATLRFFVKTDICASVGISYYVCVCVCVRVGGVRY